MEAAAAACSASTAYPPFFTRSFLFYRPPRPQISVGATPNTFDVLTTTRILRFRIRKHLRLSSLSCSSANQCPEMSPKIGLVIEVDGVFADVYRLGNRQAFNVAFQKLGLDCANWTEPIYEDLKRKAYGDEERMLILFFNGIGWPTSLPTTEKESFMKSIMREKRQALEDFAMSSSLPLRPGVENFIDEAIKEGLPIVLLSAYSRYGDKVSRSIVEKLGPDRISKAMVLGKEEVQSSYYGQLVLGKGVSSSLDDQLAIEVRKAGKYWA
ncbi:hypothetical protein AXF42_Ash020390 [Apostasia shenzhenica]|uniref:Haloacid dehalogenase-like hydrolase domain-containing protein n=1 Tax=Apostasia shenzhenica TaxID=1088818 RepID=A0A2I0A3P4_9ASPA|nr:hypothetical protein AXF42_Ash020390 [Apostasia shenzhenica]